ncbi:hypothetical protein LTR05_008461 [Lithohypha guttulata]|uniref:NmrA-like domain-containing protein n=1 Tax=Lithohypha guttulata TaxID=1690604 RepID=A0AAN7PK03_9EURO|nr:hypothetical protein LTR05_008461 [Lithohypha guttulata]
MSTYLVTGATGFQGGAVVTELLAAGMNVHAVVRNKSSPAAIALQGRGVVLFEGTHENPDKVFREAAAGCTGLFFNPTIFDPEGAKSHAKAIIQACKAGAGETLSSIVISSTYRTAEMGKNLHVTAEIHPFLEKYYASKVEVEAAVRDSRIRHITILRAPVLNYDYLLPTSAKPSAPFPQLPRSGTLTTSLNEGLTMPHLDENDIGKFATAALLNPAKFSGHEIELAGGNLSPADIRDILVEVSGIELRLHKRTAEELEDSKDREFFQVFELLTNRIPCTIDVAALEEKYGIKLTRFEQYLRRNKDKLIDSLPPRSMAAF